MIWGRRDNTSMTFGEGLVVSGAASALKMPKAASGRIMDLMSFLVMSQTV
jgi:hypothetical protein